MRASRDLTSLRALRNRAASYNTLSPPTSASAALPRATVTTMVRALVSRSSPWTPWTQKTTIYGLKHAPPGGHTRSIFAMVDSQVVCVRGDVIPGGARRVRAPPQTLGLLSEACDSVLKVQIKCQCDCDADHNRCKQEEFRRGEHQCIRRAVEQLRSAVVGEAVGVCRACCLEHYPDPPLATPPPPHRS